MRREINWLAALAVMASAAAALVGALAGGLAAAVGLGAFGIVCAVLALLP